VSVPQFPRAVSRVVGLGGGDPVVPSGMGHPALLPSTAHGCSVMGFWVLFLQLESLRPP